MFLCKSNRIGTRIRLYEYRYIGLYKVIYILEKQARVDRI